MATRRSTPDILGSILDGTAVKQESHKAIKPEVNTERMQQSHKTGLHTPQKQSESTYQQVAPQPDKEVVSEDEAKVKATFNLPLPLLNLLEDKWMEIRKITGSKLISKSLLVETALEMAFAEFDRAKNAGNFYSMLANHKTIKQ